MAKKLIIETNNTRRPIIIKIGNVLNEELQHDWDDVVGDYLADRVTAGIDDVGQPIDLIDSAKEVEWKTYAIVN